MSDNDETELRRRAIVARAEAIQGKDHYLVLGVERSAPHREIRQAFRTAVKLFHPDRLPASLADLRALAARVFDALVQAHKVLSDEAARADYDASLVSGSSGNIDAEQAEVEQALEALRAFQKAEVLVRIHKLDEAEAMARRALEFDEQPDHLALMGWIHALRGRLPQALSLLDRAVKGSPSSEKSLFYRGWVRKRAGHDRGAVDDFRRVVALNPRNLEAAREVRLHEMRQASKDLEERSFWKKLFGKKPRP